ncbi:MAG: hypothetical protein GWN01_12465, partial [Nitrosopumilaceae archaeon]|nr:hypothetical protein [Nitrosopumilaceae archaeon]NIX62289.1 hypothetical protein [Nitrosopumilaceae archaeon]
MCLFFCRFIGKIMRVISGKYKGQQIQSAKDQSIRPTTDKIKEYIFELLG